MTSKAKRRRIAYFKEQLEKRSLQDIIDIPNKSGFIYNYLKLKDYDNERININLRYLYSQDFCYFAGIPLDVNILINKYLLAYISLDLTMIIPLNYPFNPVKWVLSSVKTNYDYKFLTKYYYDKVKYYNDNLSLDWSIATLIDKEILSFIATMGDFQLIVDNIYQ